MENIISFLKNRVGILTIRNYWIIMLFTSCTLQELPQTNYDQCSGSEICVYDSFKGFLGIMENFHVYGTKINTEIQTTTGYTLYLDEKMRELDPTYQKWVLLTSVWPVNFSQMNSLGAFVDSDSSDSHGWHKGTFNFILENEDGTTVLKRMCYDETQHPPIQNQFYELLRIGSDSRYPSVFRYGFDPSSVLSPYRILPIFVCSLGETGLPATGISSFYMTNSRGDPYYGSVTEGKCELGVSHCLL